MIASRCATLGAIALLSGLLIGCSTPTSQFAAVREPAASIVPGTAFVLPAQSLQFTLSSSDLNAITPNWQVNGVVGGSASTGTITNTGLFSAPSAVTAQPIVISAQGFMGQATVTVFDPTKVQSGTVSTTQNPLVASYSLTIPSSTSMHVQFGPDTNYGFATDRIQAPTSGGATSVLVAGMRANTTYHMRGVIDLANGSQVTDTDHTFTTGSLPTGRVPNLSAQLTGVGTPNDGIELLSLDPIVGGDPLSAVATDLAGNVIWYYDLGPNYWAFPIKPLPNGDMIMVVTPTANGGLQGNEIREIDLAGNTVNRITLADVNQSLTGIASFQMAAFHHDVLYLPNGHLILLGDYNQTFDNLVGLPAGTVVTGDALVEWDPLRGVVWAWSAFDHLDPARIPYGVLNGVADWTHSNAVIYSPDDGNLIVSMRNQDWILKIAYQNGTGNGDVLWHLGMGGDFSLPSGQPATEWNSGQHYPTIASSNSSGVFSLMFFNNGNARGYSSLPIFQLNEYAKTVDVLWEDNFAPNYSICCGSALLLPNGDVEYDIAFNILTPHVSHLQEVTQTLSPQLVWSMDIQDQLAYRGMRIPSLYPGQSWPAVTQATKPISKRHSSAMRKQVPISIEKLP